MMDGGIEFWLVWAALLFSQQSTFLFSGRAKTSGSLSYAGWSALFSHSTWFFSNLYFVHSVIVFRDAPLLTQISVCLFYVFWCTLGTLVAMKLALRIERGKMAVGAK